MLYTVLKDIIYALFFVVCDTVTRENMFYGLLFRILFKIMSSF